MRVVSTLRLALIAGFMASGATAENIGDAEKGERVFKKCTACHQVGAGAKNRVGPHLNGVFGRPAGSLDDFNYSKSMLRAGADGLVWTEEVLLAFLENPKTMVSKTKMNFKGLKKPIERADVLAYLRDFSDKPSNIPEAEPTAHPTAPHVDPAILAMKGDPEYGEYLSNECLTCHQASGGDDGIPSITGWPSEDFAAAMHAYKERLRPHPVMQMMAGRLSNEEIAALAAYFGGLE